MTSAFDGVRVLELGQIYNGPYCGLLLAQLGADVIKIEPPGGEQLRFRSHEPTESHEFVMLNSNKRSVVLDLKTDAGRQALLDLVETADVLIENFAPGTMERLAARPGATPRAQPASDRRLRQGLRIHRPLRPHVGDGHHRAGDVGRRRHHRRARRATDQGRPRLRRLLRRHPPVRGDQRRRCSSGNARDGGRSSRSRCTTPSTRCWPRAWAACTTTPTGSSPSAPGTGTRAWPSRPTTSTRPATDGWPSSASPSGTGAGWQRPWAGPS